MRCIAWFMYYLHVGQGKRQYKQYCTAVAAAGLSHRLCTPVFKKCFVVRWSEFVAETIRRKEANVCHSVTNSGTPESSWIAAHRPAPEAQLL